MKIKIPLYNTFFKKKMKASSLLETVTSMVIVTIIFGIAMTVVFRLGKFTMTRSRAFADSEISKFYMETIDNRSFYDEKRNAGEFIVEKKVGEYEGSKDIVMVDITVYDADFNKVAGEKRLIRP